MTALFPSRVIGHRGAAASAPENTRAGLAAAARLGVLSVEFDVQLSADAVPVLFHDDTLDRTTNGRGLVAGTPYAELACLDAGSWFSPEFAGETIPSLAEAIATLGDLGLHANIEIKADESRGEETARIALDLARRLWPGDRLAPVISSFSLAALAAAAQIVPEWPRSLLVDSFDGEWRQTAHRLGCRGVHANARRLDRESVAAAKRGGLALCAYTVNSPGRAVRLFGWGVDAVFSDRPERIVVPPGGM